MNDYSFLIDSMTWSYSRLQSYQKCPYGFFVHYILGEDEDADLLFYALKKIAPSVEEWLASVK